MSKKSRDELLEEVRHLAGRVNTTELGFQRAQKAYTAALWALGDWLVANVPNFGQGDSGKTARNFGLISTRDVAEVTGLTVDYIGHLRSTAAKWPADKRTEASFSVHKNAIRRAKGDIEKAREIIDDKPTEWHNNSPTATARGLETKGKRSKVIEKLRDEGKLEDVAKDINAALAKDALSDLKKIRAAKAKQGTAANVKPPSADEAQAIRHYEEAIALYRQGNRHLELGNQHAAALNSVERNKYRKSLSGTKARITMAIVSMQRAKDTKKQRRAA